MALSISNTVWETNWQEKQVEATEKATVLERNYLPKYFVLICPKIKTNILSLHYPDTYNFWWSGVAHYNFYCAPCGQNRLKNCCLLYFKDIRTLYIFKKKKIHLTVRSNRL